MSRRRATTGSCRCSTSTELTVRSCAPRCSPSSCLSGPSSSRPCERSSHSPGASRSRVSPARLLITSGVMGSGKSTVARAVAARLGAIVIRTDAVRKRLGGVGIHERATTGFEEGLYTSDMSNRTYAKALRLAAEVLGAGWTVIVDGSFSKAAERAEARARGPAPWPGARHALVRDGGRRHRRTPCPPRCRLRRRLGWAPPVASGAPCAL